jgi:hypothetical protein
VAATADIVPAYQVYRCNERLASNNTLRIVPLHSHLPNYTDEGRPACVSENDGITTALLADVPSKSGDALTHTAFMACTKDVSLNALTSLDHGPTCGAREGLS